MHINLSFKAGRQDNNAMNQMYLHNVKTGNQIQNYLAACASSSSQVTTAASCSSQTATGGSTGEGNIWVMGLFASVLKITLSPTLCGTALLPLCCEGLVVPQRKG